MASGFWYLEDGRCFAKKWSLMFNLLDLINKEIKLIEGADQFATYLDYHIWDAENDEYNGYGGFIRKRTEEDVSINMDLREFSDANRKYFWEAAQNALNKLIIANDESNEGVVFYLKILLDMHKRIKQGEAPESLSDTGAHIEPFSGEKKGPGWE